MRHTILLCSADFSMIDIVDNFRVVFRIDGTFPFWNCEFALQGTHVIDQFLRHNLGLIFCLEASMSWTAAPPAHAVHVGLLRHSLCNSARRKPATIDLIYEINAHLLPASCSPTSVPCGKQTVCISSLKIDYQKKI